MANQDSELRAIYEAQKREPGFPLGVCAAIADRIQERFGHPRIDGWIAIGNERYLHSWNTDREVIIEGGTVYQYNGLASFAGEPSFKSGPRRIKPEDPDYPRYKTKRK